MNIRKWNVQSSLLVRCAMSLMLLSLCPNLLPFGIENFCCLAGTWAQCLENILAMDHQPIRVLLRNNKSPGNSPGDILMLTAAVRDLHRSNRRRFLTAVETSCEELWQHNPYIVPVSELGAPDCTIDCAYPLIHQSHRPFHFIHGFAQFLAWRLRVQIEVSDFRGDIHLSQEELDALSPLQRLGRNKPLWIIVAGGKYDLTAKWWSPSSYQAIVDHFRERIQFVQCGDSTHWHPPLEGVISLVGKTSIREFVNLMYHADGVVCPVTFAMHLAAAVPLRPGQLSRGCVVVAGGREPAHWEMYSGHQFLHTQGALSCCASGGCWKSRCQPMNDGDGMDEDLCTMPVAAGPNLLIPKCMDLITPQRVIDAVQLYYDGGALKWA